MYRCVHATVGIYLWRITPHHSFPTAAAGHPVIKFTRARESELSRRLPGNITVSGCKCNGCVGYMHLLLQGQMPVCAAVRHRPAGRSESVASADSWTCQGPTTPRHWWNQSNPALPAPPPLTPSLYQTQKWPQSESTTGGHTARTGHYRGALQSELHAGRPPLPVDRSPDASHLPRWATPAVLDGRKGTLGLPKHMNFTHF